MELLAAFAILACAATFAAWQRDRREWSTERGQLLDRIMARSYADFVHTTTVTGVETPQMTSDEAEAAWHEQNKAKHPDQYPDEALA